MFEKASRYKLRFHTTRGRISVEDLWDLPLLGGSDCLDEIAKGLRLKVKDSAEESFVVKSDKKDDVLQLKFEIVKHIIEVRLKEAEAAANAKVLREKKQQIMSIIADKESEALRGKDVDELKKLLESM